MQNQAPITFEIDFTHTPTGKVPRRLEAAERKSLPLTLAQINERLSTAAQKRALRISQQSLSAKDELEKISLVRERRCSEDRAIE